MRMTHDNTTFGLDLAKNVFYCKEMNQNIRMMRQRKLKRDRVLGNFSNLVATKIRCVAMEASGGSDHAEPSTRLLRSQLRLLRICLQAIIRTELALGGKKYDRQLNG